MTKTIFFDGTYKIGIPIGNYTSQFFANIYLNELDHFVKEKLKVKYYIRYMDDFVILVKDKEMAKHVKNEIAEFLDEKLQLKLNMKTNYTKNSQGVSFCGCRIYINQIKLRGYNKKKIYKRVKNWNKEYKEHTLDLIRAGKSLQSWKGHALHADSYEYVNKIIQKCNWIYK